MLKETYQVDGAPSRLPSSSVATAATAAATAAAALTAGAGKGDSSKGKKGKGKGKGKGKQAKGANKEVVAEAAATTTDSAAAAAAAAEAAKKKTTIKINPIDEVILKMGLKADSKRWLDCYNRAVGDASPTATDPYLATYLNISTRADLASAKTTGTTADYDQIIRRLDLEKTDNPDPKCLAAAMGNGLDRQQAEWIQMQCLMQPIVGQLLKLEQVDGQIVIPPAVQHMCGWGRRMLHEKKDQLQAPGLCTALNHVFVLLQAKDTVAMTSEMVELHAAMKWFMQPIKGALLQVQTGEGRQETVRSWFHNAVSLVQTRDKPLGQLARRFEGSMLQIETGLKSLQDSEVFCKTLPEPGTVLPEAQVSCLLERIAAHRNRVADQQLEPALTRLTSHRHAVHARFTDLLLKDHDAGSAAEVLAKFGPGLSSDQKLSLEQMHALAASIQKVRGCATGKTGFHSWPLSGVATSAAASLKAGFPSFRLLFVLMLSLCFSHCP
jgi:hypothetical protein